MTDVIMESVWSRLVRGAHRFTSQWS